jgi:hypothetical protein
VEIWVREKFIFSSFEFLTFLKFLGFFRKDGGLWVVEQSEKFKGGFRWEKPGFIRFDSNLFGIGVDAK